MQYRTAVFGMELGTDKPLQCGNLNNFHQVRFGVYTHTLHTCCFVGILEAVVELVAVTVTFLDMLGTICLVCLAAFLQNSFVGTQTHGSTHIGDGLLLFHDVDDIVRCLFVHLA